MDSKHKLEATLSLVILILLFNTVLFHVAEGWGWVDSFYFSGMTLTTVGYGDLVPTKDFTKIVVTIDAIFSIGIFLYALTILGESRFSRMPDWVDFTKPIRKVREATSKRQQAKNMSPNQRRQMEIFKEKKGGCR